jgi:hypothetical protein
MATAKSNCGVKIHAALKSVKEVVVVSRTLEFHFAPTYGFAREMIDEPRVKAQVENAWRQVLGEAVSIRCVLQGSSAQAGKGGEKRDNAGGDALLEDAKRRGAVIKQLD